MSSYIVQRWPRDPNGATIKETPEGKMTPNGNKLWGATSQDFFYVSPCAGLHAYATVNTGSRLAKWMRANGEVDTCKDELKFADAEPEPCVIGPYDISRFIEDLEIDVWNRRIGEELTRDETTERKTDSCMYPISSYPAPWPLEPFSTPLPRLQKIIPLDSLPRTLVIHDPWSLLELKRYPEGTKTKWGSLPDRIHRYTLQRSKKLQEAVSGGPDVQATATSEAHLYITPSRLIGKGNHSFVYQAELETQRDSLVDYQYCYRCATEAAVLAGAIDATFTRDDPSAATQDEEDEGFKVKVSTVENEELFGTIRFAPSQKIFGDMQVAPNGVRLDKVKQAYTALFDDADWHSTAFILLKYVRQQCRSSCEHEPLSDDKTRAALDGMFFDQLPPSAKAIVVAKLSIQSKEHERHLSNEAYIYESFPQHLFEHWSGFNIVHPLKALFPVVPVVPAFYGYYVPDATNEPIKEGRYMSPILLMEHCGVQVDAADLPVDQKEECASLLRRLHSAGYIHNSPFPRNFLMTKGPLEAEPSKRSKDSPSFRIADFGRTVKVEGEQLQNEKMQEQTMALGQLGLAVGKYSQTWISPGQ